MTSNLQSLTSFQGLIALRKEETLQLYCFIVQSHACSDLCSVVSAKSSVGVVCLCLVFLSQEKP